MAALVHTYQMAVLFALSNSYSTTALYLQSVKWPQSVVSSLVPSLFTIPMWLGLAYTKPANRVPTVRPTDSFFRRSSLTSVMAQAALNVGCMSFVVSIANRHTPLSKVGLLGPREFVPNMVTNVVFLLSLVQEVGMCLVNFKGRPFMTGVLELRPVLFSGGATLLLCLVLTTEIFPGLNEMFELAPFPSLQMKAMVLVAMTVSVLGGVAVDRLAVKVFDPDLHKARTHLKLSQKAKVNLRYLAILLAFALIQMSSLSQ
ncbi:unnamed protein product [Discosporangium mesarthrocarpum]